MSCLTAQCVLLCLCASLVLVGACNDHVLAALTCGDGVCGPKEDGTSCPADCGPQCGNTFCEATEDHQSCPADCETLSLVILDDQSTDATPLPIEGATVAFDRPSGVRVEKSTGADGRVTFDAFDWTSGSGRVAVTAYKPGYVMESAVGYDATAVAAHDDRIGDALVWRLGQLQPDGPPTVTVSGHVTGMQDVGREYHVRVLRAPYSDPAVCSVPGDQWFTMSVAQNHPFTLLVVESEQVGLPSGRGHEVLLHQALIRDFGPLSMSPGAQALDFAAEGIASATAVGSMALPSRADSPLLAGYPDVYVRDGISDHELGWAEHVDINGSGDGFDFTALWVEPPLVTDVHTYYRVAVGRAFSEAREPGYPQPGPLTPPLLDSARWIEPATPAAAHPLHAPLRWELFDEVDTAFVAILRGGELRWMVGANFSLTGLTIPLAPSTVSELDFLGPSPEVVIVLTRELDGFEPAYRVSQSESIGLEVSQ